MQEVLTTTPPSTIQNLIYNKYWQISLTMKIASVSHMVSEVHVIYIEIIFKLTSKYSCWTLRNWWDHLPVALSFIVFLLIEDVLTFLGYTALRRNKSCEISKKQVQLIFWRSIQQILFEVILTSVDTIQKVLQAGKAADVSISKILIAWRLLVVLVRIVYTDLLLGENEEGGNEEEQASSSIISLIWLILLSASGKIYQFAKSDCWRIDWVFYRSAQGRM